MTRTEFLSQLAQQLCHLPQPELDAAVSYHNGIIDGRIEGGLSEEDAVAAFVSPTAAALDYLKKTTTPQKHVITRKIKAMPPALRVVLSGILSGFCFLAIAVLWIASAAVYLAAGFIALASVAALICGFVFCFTRTLPIGLCTIGVAIVGIAVALFLFSVAVAVAKLFKGFTATILSKVRTLLAKEALAV